MSFVQSNNCIRGVMISVHNLNGRLLVLSQTRFKSKPTKLIFACSLLSLQHYWIKQI